MIAWEKFLTAVARARDELGCTKTGAWFRGVRSSKHRLYPSLLRPRASIGLRREKDIYLEYSDFSETSSSIEGSWERLIKLQHHGSPTRLLDWTEVFGVALYFALGPVGEALPNQQPAIWIMNPFAIASVARGSADKSIGEFHTDKKHDYYECFIKNECWPFEKPMPFRPPKLTPRIRAQRGFFTVHGKDKRPLDRIYRGHVRQIRLESDAHKDARRFLELAGLDSLTMFPDIDGFTRRIRERYQY